jgi:hypothetical protein
LCFQKRSTEDTDPILHVNVSGDGGGLLGLDEGGGPGAEAGPVLLAQIEGPAPGRQTQTVIIQAPPGSKLDGNNLTPEIYEVLRNLSARVGQGGGGTSIMVSQINQEMGGNGEGLLLGMEGLGGEGNEEGDETKDYLPLGQMQPREELYVDDELVAVSSALAGGNRVIVSDGEKQIEVDISPTNASFQPQEQAGAVSYQEQYDGSSGGIKLEHNVDAGDTQDSDFFQADSDVPASLASSLASFEHNSAAPGQFIMADEATGTPLQQQQFLQGSGAHQHHQQQQQQQQQVLVQIDENLGLPGGVSLEQLQQLLQQQQILQQLQVSSANPQQVHDVTQISLDAAQLAQLGAVSGDQVPQVQITGNLGADQVHISGNQVQIGDQFFPIVSQQQQVHLGDDQVPYQVSISAEQVPQQVQLLADQVLGQQQ